MGPGAKPADSDASLLPQEAGVRLRQLRLQAGLTEPDDNWTTEHGLPREPLTGVKQAVIITQFADTERKGELD